MKAKHRTVRAVDVLARAEVERLRALGQAYAPTCECTSAVHEVGAALLCVNCGAPFLKRASSR